MIKRFGRWLILPAVVVVVVLATLVVTTVVDAQNRGRAALATLEQQQIEQLADSLETRVVTLFTSIDILTARPYTLRVGDPADAAILGQFVQPSARTGFFLVDLNGTITNGVLFRDLSVVGTRYARPEIRTVLTDGKPVVLPVGPALTTAFPAIALAAPVKDANGAVRGAMVFEADVSPSSDFNKEVAALGRAGSGQFFVLDSSGTVLAATDDALLDQSFTTSDVFTSGPGLRHVGDEVHAVGLVPSAGWRVVFRESTSAFERGLAQRIQTAILLIVVAGLLLGGLTVVLLLWRLRAARIEQQRMTEINEARERFISIVSHELRTPAAGVLGFLESTLDHWNLLDDGARRDAVARAVANARRLNVLTRDVLDASSAETGTLHYAFGPVDLVAEVRGAAVSAGEMQDGRQIDVRAPDAPLWVRADADRVRQVLLNLFDNALKSSPVDTPIEVDAVDADGQARVTIIDHGAGLSTDEVDRIFDKFVRGRASSGGAGLGLYVSRQIVDAHGGRIWAESRPDGGAAFTFTIPLSSPPPSSAPETAATVGSPT